jgi:hypothetical protein
MTIVHHPPSHRRFFCHVAIACVLLLFFAGAAAAQDTHLLVIVGVGGSEELTASFHKWATAAIDGAKRSGLPDANIKYLGERPDTTRATRENVTKALADLAATSKPEDLIFVLLIGHGSFDGRQAAFNLPGPDLSAPDYATLLDRFKSQRIVFVNTASSSGAFLEPLAGPGRTIVTATKTGGERNATRFPEFFVEALNGDAADRDRSGRVSVAEAFDFARTSVEAAYQKEGHILTEHATLDDSSEGKLASVQFLAPERSRTAAMANADPALRALVEQQEALQRQINALQQRKSTMDATQYEQQLEKLLTELALKTRAIREMEAKR